MLGQHMCGNIAPETSLRSLLCGFLADSIGLLLLHMSIAGRRRHLQSVNGFVAVVSPLAIIYIVQKISDALGNLDLTATK